MKNFIFSSVLFFMILTIPQVAYSQKELQEMPGIKTGSRVPDFEAITHEGKKITLSDLYKKGPVVLIFYRGAWCPYCSIHLRDFQWEIDSFKKHNASILAVSVDMRNYGKKMVKKNQLDFDVISDSNGELLDAFGLLNPLPPKLFKKYRNDYGINLEKYSGRQDGLIGVPATYVINSSGIVVFAYANHDYKVRTTPEEVLQVLDELI